MNKIEMALLEKVSGLHKIPVGAVNIRKNGEAVKRTSTSEIEIVPKKDGSGIDVFVKPNVKGKSVHIPVLITVGGIDEVVYNDFYIGENADITIIAGCGIHNSSCNSSTHNGIHTFHLAKNSRVKYYESHVGEGEGSGGKILNPITKIYQDDGSQMDMQTIQIGGITSTVRKTYASLKNKAKLIVTEKLLTTDFQTADTDFKINLIGAGSSAQIVSRSVAKNYSTQQFKSTLIGKNRCFGHVECDGILLDEARIVSVPKIDAADCNASLIHEAAIGKIAGEEFIKLMTLGLTRQQAEEAIIQGFLMGDN